MESVAFDRDRVLKLLDGTRSLREVAIEVGATKAQVRHLAIRHGRPWRNDSHLCLPKVSPERIVEVFDRDGTIAGTAAELGVVRNTVRKYLIRAGRWPA